MKTYIVHLTGFANWLITENDPMTYDMSWEPGIEFVNPILYSSMLGVSTYGEDNIEFGIHSGHIISTSSLLFIEDRKDWEDKRVLGDLVARLEDFLYRLRYCSLQTTMPTTIDSIEFGSINSLPALDWKNRCSQQSGYVRQATITFAVRCEAIRDASEMMAEPRCPIYEDILLDAFQSYYDGDFRKAVLYSAIAMDAAVAKVTDDAYERVKRNPESHPEMRIQQVRVDRNKVVLIDAVYQHLSERTDFATKVHERSLYMMGRSLKYDDPTLFQSAKKLYQTRNQIVHQGEPQLDAGLLTLDAAGAVSAVDCAADVLKWLGVSRYSGKLIRRFTAAQIGTH